MIDSVFLKADQFKNFMFFVSFGLNFIPEGADVASMPIKIKVDSLKTVLPNLMSSVGSISSGLKDIQLTVNVLVQLQRSLKGLVNTIKDPAAILRSLVPVYFLC